MNNDLMALMITKRIKNAAININIPNIIPVNPIIKYTKKSRGSIPREKGRNQASKSDDILNDNRQPK